MRPRILQTDDQIGFSWATPDGMPTTLPQLLRTDDEPDRLLATHLSALDDALIIAAERFGQLLGGGRVPDAGEREHLAELYQVLDRLCAEYATGCELTGITPDERAGQIVGTAALFSIRARQPLGLLGPAPLDGQLDEPGIGVVAGFGELVHVDPDRPWAGGRWVVRTEDGRRLPLTLSTLLFDSSGTNKDAAREEHREMLRAVVAAAARPEADPFEAACALDWLLYDFLMAHRDGPDSAAIVFGKADADADGRLVVEAVAASVAVRSAIDPGLMLRV
ncbi:hypothetical protein [Pseudonocardia thermophila]|mgnify:CR=1 FL=1|jgi:hypothetical protein|uniref:hypothetical protein n=1 Tax=Pseudonocardia thermophila TaxID=1848 RepID=UPI00248E8CF9|nr:hypothetical protein [Pseudonocardia thermophila]